MVISAGCYATLSVIGCQLQEALGNNLPPVGIFQSGEDCYKKPLNRKPITEDRQLLKNMKLTLL